MSAKTAKILVTIDDESRADAIPRVRALLKQAGAPKAVILQESPSGLIEAWVPGDPRPVVERLERLFRHDPTSFVGTHHWYPVESWTGSDPRDLAKFAELFNKSLRSSESWKVEVRKHEAEIGSHELIDNIAALISQPEVDLDHPDRILMLNVLGDRIGVADVTPGQIFDTHRAALRSDQESVLSGKEVNWDED